MKIRINPLFPENGLAKSLGIYWRELANYLNEFQNFPHQWRKQQYGAYKTLTSSSASIAVNLSLSNNFTHSLTENTTLSAPTNPKAGQAGIIEFIQNGSAAKTLAFNAFWLFNGGTDPTISTTLSSKSILSYVVNSAGDKAYCSWIGPLS